ncbi:lytic transglycosylase domain-containing protein [Thermodesulfobacteriota bacterium]
MNPYISQGLVSALLLTVLVQLLPGSAVAAPQQTDFQSWLSGLRAEARSRGISESTLQKALADVKPSEQILVKDRNQPEFKKTLSTYLTSALSDQRINTGIEKLREKKALLRQVTEQYGVPSRFLVALWGIESYFGRITGQTPVVQSLVTLAYDPRRGSYFRKELLDALFILDEGQIPFDRLRGSWAGAMGQLQFMPSTFRNNAVDANGDGTIHIWQDGMDLFASGANYLARAGWQKGWTWGREIALPADFDRSLIEHGKKTLSQWQDLGVRRVNGRDLPRAETSALLIQPDGPTGRAFLVYKNFEVLLTWNRSYNFALAVGLLADRLIHLQ